MKRIILFLAIVIAGASPVATAQDAAVKTNLLSDTFLNPNLGIETGLSPRWTLDISGLFNAMTMPHTTCGGNIWSSSRKPDTGSVTGSLVISSAHICMAEYTIPEVWT